MRRQDRPSPAMSVAVIGAGFSGVLTAIHLLAQGPALTVRLIERADRFGPGRAYDAANSGHLLNVRAANMSAFPDRPGHFVDWLGAKGVDASGDAFVSRGRYGEYLQDLLRGAVTDPTQPARLLLEHDEAVAAERTSQGWRVQLALGRTLDVDMVVLAVGLGPPRALPGLTPAAEASPAYVADPWRIDPQTLPGGDILLLGSGLTMVDVALSIARPDRRLLALSRRGLTPHSHAVTAPSQLPDGPLQGPRQTLRALRGLAAETGWRSAVDGVRPITSAAWQNWSLAERRRFLRHLRPWWDIHRHRMAPEVARRVEALRADARLAFCAGQIVSIDVDGRGLIVVDRPRGAIGARTRRFQAVVNCTGLSSDLEGSALLAALMRNGHVRPDALGLGADVDGAGRLISMDGAPSPTLCAVGPLTRATHWESVAVPDLRTHAANVARLLVQLSGPQDQVVVEYPPGRRDG